MPSVGMHIQADKDCILHISYVVLRMYEENSTQQSAMFLGEQNDQILRCTKHLLRRTTDGFLILVKANHSN